MSKEVETCVFTMRGRSNSCLDGTVTIQLSWLWHLTQPPTPHCSKGPLLLWEYTGQHCFSFELVFCVRSYSSNMEIFPCRRYKLLLSTVPVTLHSAVREAVFCFNPKLWEKFLCEKMVCSPCSPYAMSHPAPFEDILEELRMWYLDSGRINSVPSFLH